MRRLVLVLILCVPLVATTQESGSLLVGVSKRDISPTPATAPPDGTVNLGGFGEEGAVRRSTGVLAPIYVRAMVVSNGPQTVAFVTTETQGAFAIYKSGPYGLIDVAAKVEAATMRRIPRQHVLISSVHSHSAPDTTGLWGGVPDSYLAYVRDQTVGAITDAVATLQPARLEFATANLPGLLRSQLDEAPNNRVDGQMRLLVAVDPADRSRRLAALVNFSAHADVLDAGNTLLSADWPGVVAGELEEALDIDTALVMVGAIGRTQPKLNTEFPRTSREKLTGYARAVVSQVLGAARRLTPQTGTGIAMTQLFLRERYANPSWPMAKTTGATSRGGASPWLDGDTIGTVVSAARIGDLLFAGVPGEAYPAIQFGVRDSVRARGHFFFGLANDQLGYLISPAEGYPQVAAAASKNDNARFNVSPSIGDHVLCTLIEAATQVGFPLSGRPDSCKQFAGEDHTLPF